MACCLKADVYEILVTAYTKIFGLIIVFTKNVQSIYTLSMEQTVTHLELPCPLAVDKPPHLFL